MSKKNFKVTNLNTRNFNYHTLSRDGIRGGMEWVTMPEHAWGWTGNNRIVDEFGGGFNIKGSRYGTLYVEPPLESSKDGSGNFLVFVDNSGLGHTIAGGGGGGIGYWTPAAPTGGAIGGATGGNNHIRPKADISSVIIYDDKIASINLILQNQSSSVWPQLQYTDSSNQDVSLDNAALIVMDKMQFLEASGNSAGAGGLGTIRYTYQGPTGGRDPSGSSFQGKVFTSLGAKWVKFGEGSITHTQYWGESSTPFNYKLSTALSSQSMGTAIEVSPADCCGNYSLALGQDCSSGKYSLALGNHCRTTSILGGAAQGGALAIGSNCDASGEYSVAMGESNTAGGRSSVAMGSGNVAVFASVAMGCDCSANGHYSVAMGNINDASGTASVAMGWNNKASGAQAVAMGWKNEASGNNAVAMGESNTASGAQAVAMGGGNTAGIGNYAVAMGWNNTASGDHSVAMGRQNTARGADAVAMGKQNTAIGQYSVAMGYDCSAGIASFADGSGCTAWDECNVALGCGADASGTCCFMYKDICGNEFCFDSAAAPNAGHLVINGQIIGGGTDHGLWKTVGAPQGIVLEPKAASGIPPDPSGIKLQHTLIYGTDAAGLMVGDGNTASGPNSVAMGCGNTANESTAVAMGDGNTANGTYAVAMGKENTASASSAVAMGTGNTASGAQASVAMGEGNTACKPGSVAMGAQNTASGDGSVAMGGSNTASGQSAVAMGEYNTASAWASVAMGRQNTASGLYSVAMGMQNTASGEYSVAMGYDCSAGIASFADGSGCTAWDECNVALGCGADASGTCCFMYKDICGNSFCFDSGGSDISGNIKINGTIVATAAGAVTAYGYKMITTTTTKPGGGGLWNGSSFSVLEVTGLSLSDLTPTTRCKITIIGAGGGGSGGENGGARNGGGGGGGGVAVFQNTMDASWNHAGLLTLGAGGAAGGGGAPPAAGGEGGNTTWMAIMDASYVDVALPTMSLGGAAGGFWSSSMGGNFAEGGMAFSGFSDGTGAPTAPWTPHWYQIGGEGWAVINRQDGGRGGPSYDGLPGGLTNGFSGHGGSGGGGLQRVPPAYGTTTPSGPPAMSGVYFPGASPPHASFFPRVGTLDGIDGRWGGGGGGGVCGTHVWYGGDGGKGGDALMIIEWWL